MSFQLWPAIDVLGGKVVRLKQGDYNAVTTYEQSLSSLVSTINAFADGIHIVDLDGARNGRSAVGSTVNKILATTPLRVELGGGLRTIEALGEALDLGLTRAIIGSRAVSDSAFVKEAIARFGPRRVVVGVDLKDGRTATNGWTETADQSAEQLLERLARDGVRTIIVTDIHTDGMMQGPNVGLIRRLTTAFPDLDIVASGGVASIEDLKQIRDTGAKGAVFGRAWIEGALPWDALQAFSAEA